MKGTTTPVTNGKETAGCGGISKGEFAVRCQDVMSRNPKCCVPTDTAARAAKLVNIEDAGSVPVCESRHGKRLVGMVTDGELALYVVAEGRDANGTTVQNAMTRDPLTCRASGDLQMALDFMELNQVRCIPVVDETGMMIGIIAQADIAMRIDKPANEMVEMK